MMQNTICLYEHMLMSAQVRSTPDVNINIQYVYMIEYMFHYPFTWFIRKDERRTPSPKGLNEHKGDKGGREGRWRQTKQENMPLYIVPVGCRIVNQPK